jgi:hypothetical protein
MSQTPPPSGDWAAQAADTIERVVEKIRSRTTQPAITVARALVYGLLVAILGVAVLVWVLIAWFRVLDIILPGGMWASYVLMGVVFVIIGAILMHMRHAPPEAS